ncbi:MAG: hypothetical protein WDM71_08875 [Ferruginibacter sp.]
MNNKLNNILSNSNDNIDNQKLLDYLNNELNKTDSHELEKNMADDNFVNDAVEGLQEFGSKKNMQAYVAQLNNELNKQIAKKKKEKINENGKISHGSIFQS